MIDNHEAWLKGLLWIITLALIGWAIDWLRCQGLKPVEKQGTNQVMKASKLVYALAYGSILFWIALIVLSTLFPGRTENLWLAQGIFALFLVMSILLAWSCHTWVIQWNDAVITGPNWHGKPLQIDWTEAVQLNYGSSFQAFLLKSRDGRTIWVPEYGMGVDDFLAFLQESHPHLLPPPECPEDGDHEH